MFAVTVVFEVSAENMQAFLPLVQANARASVEVEAGCQQFDVCVDPERPGEVFLYELYDDEAAFQSHMREPHYASFNEQAGPMIAAKSVSTFSRVLR